MSENHLQLLNILSDGQIHSGEALGEMLGVSRTAVWKQLKKLEVMGVPINTVKGRGYCLPPGVSMINPGEVKSGLTEEAKQLLSQLLVEPCVGSTNEIVKTKVGEQDVSGMVVTAERQTSGRGRRGREWYSPFGRNMYFSTAWQFESGVAALEGLSLAVGVAVVDALTDLGVTGLGLKWPNDIVSNGRKIGGILLEMTGDPAGACQVVVGVGLNVNMPEDASNEIDQAWTDLASVAGRSISRDQLLAAMINRILPLLSRYEQETFKAYKERWQKLDSFRDEEVSLVTTATAVTGVARGVTDQGAVRLEVDGDIREFHGGEISMRAKQ